MDDHLNHYLILSALLNHAEVMPHGHVITMQHSSTVIPLFSSHKSHHCLTNGNIERVAFVGSNFSFSGPFGNRNNNRVIYVWQKIRHLWKFPILVEKSAVFY